MLGALDLVDFLVQPPNLLVYVPHGLCASEDFVKQRVRKGIGLIRSDIRVLRHALPESSQDRDFLFARAFLRLEFVKLGFEVSDGVQLWDLWVSIKYALIDEEPCVSKSIYAEGLGCGVAAKIRNFDNVVSCLSHADVVRRGCVPDFLKLTLRSTSSFRITCAPEGRWTVTDSIGRPEPSNENSVVGRDATMAEKETADVVIDSGHSYGSWGMSRVCGP